MRRTFIKKEGVVITTLARYLLGEKCGNRLKTIDELATECRSSVGLTQAALKTLESSGAIRIERRGRNGSYLVEMDNKALLSHVDINNVVCAMPLPYTRLYEGLASGLKAQFDGIPFYYAHMRGADIRVECLLNGVYDMAVVSRLAAESYLTQKGLCLALELGPHTYVGEHQLICRKGESANVKRVGLDNRSADQKIMTDVFFGDSDVERVDLSYHESLQRIVKGDVDAVIWNVVAENELTMLGLEATPLTDDPRFLQATEAVVLTRVDDYPMQQLLRAVVDKHALLAHQQRVVVGNRNPVIKRKASDMETRLNLLCDAGVIDKDICKGMMQVVNVLETECHLPVRSEQGTMAMTHMASALMRSRRGEEIEPLDDELLAELAQSSHWQAVVQLHQVLLKEFALEVNPCEEGYLLANLYGLWMAANEEV